MHSGDGGSPYIKDRYMYKHGLGGKAVVIVGCTFSIPAQRVQPSNGTTYKSAWSVGLRVIRIMTLYAGPPLIDFLSNVSSIAHHKVDLLLYLHIISLPHAFLFSPSRV